MIGEFIPPIESEDYKGFRLEHHAEHVAVVDTSVEPFVTLGNFWTRDEAIAGIDQWHEAAAWLAAVGSV